VTDHSQLIGIFRNEMKPMMLLAPVSPGGSQIIHGRQESPIGYRYDLKLNSSTDINIYSRSQIIYKT